MKAAKVFGLVVVYFVIFSSVGFAQASPTEEDQVSCYGPCIWIPFVQGIFREYFVRIAEPIGVTPEMVETYRGKASVLDNTTGHNRLWFGTAESQITMDRCDITLAGDDPENYHGIANVKYDFGEGDPPHTYLRDGEARPGLVPVASWRLVVTSSPEVLELEAQLRLDGHAGMGDAVKALYEAGGEVLVVQLNRREILGMALDASYSGLHRFELVCHQ